MALEYFFVGQHMKNKKLFFTSLFVGLILFGLFSGKPTEAFVGFLAAGTIPGVKFFTVGPYLMVILTFTAIATLAYKLYNFELPMVEKNSKPVHSVKITAQTHHKSAARRQKLKKASEAA